MPKPRRRHAFVPATITLTPPVSIPLNQLIPSSSNVRTIHDEASIGYLADSIARRGLLQSLSVRAETGPDGAETGRFEVQGGGRRLRALTLLVSQQRLAADAPVPCIVKTGGLAEEDSFAENNDRAALHPLDQFKAFAALKAKGQGEEAIAAAFNVTAAVVRQRLRLASASPVLLDAYVSEDIDLDQLMAFCVTEDHARQERVLEAVKGTHNDQPWTIRRMLTESTVRASDRRVRFVGLEAYEAAGGAVWRDLFDEDGESYLQDPDLLNRLVQEKLDAVAAELRAQGWKWVVARPEIPYSERQTLDRLVPLATEPTEEEQARAEALEAELESLHAAEELTDEEQERVDTLEAELAELTEKPPTFLAEDRARAGAFLSLDHDGGLSVLPGYVRPEDRQGPSDPSPGTGTVPPAEAVAAVEADEEADTLKPLSERLVMDLTSYRTVALREALGHSFETAFVAVLHALCLGHFYTYARESCLQIDLKTGFAATAAGLDTWPGTKALDDRDAAMRALLPASAADLWSALLRLEDETRRCLFAHVASMAVNAVREPHQVSTGKMRHGDQLASALGLHMASAGWVTTAENYLGRVTKGHILAAVREAKGDTAAELIADLRKDEMAREAERLLQGTGWVPDALRAPEIGDPGPGGLPVFLTSNDPVENAV